MGKSGSGPRACNVFVAALVVLVPCLQNTLKSEEVITKIFFARKGPWFIFTESFLQHNVFSYFWLLCYNSKTSLHLCSPTCYPVQFIEFSLCLLTKVVAWLADASAINEQKILSKNTRILLDHLISNPTLQINMVYYLADAYLLQNQK